MTTPNDITLQAYQNGWRQYLENSPRVPLNHHGHWLSDALNQNRKPPLILEIGSGSGHDARNFEDAGFRVERSDATPAFVNHLRTQGYPARQLNILTDDPGGPFGMIYAFAVFQHFTDDEFGLALCNCADALEPGGVIAFSMRRGTGSEWEERKGMERRFFNYWQPGRLWDAVEVAGLQMKAMHQDTKTADDGAGIAKTWLLVTAIKPRKENPS
jgi:SAM-dependent methyltransferase